MARTSYVDEHKAVCEECREMGRWELARDGGRAILWSHLMSGTPIKVEDQLVSLEKETIQEGDFYVAAGGGAFHLFIASFVNDKDGWIAPEGFGYPFNTSQCYKVRA